MCPTGGTSWITGRPSCQLQRRELHLPPLPRHRRQPPRRLPHQGLRPGLRPGLPAACRPTACPAGSQGSPPRLRCRRQRHRQPPPQPRPQPRQRNLPQHLRQRGGQLWQQPLAVSRQQCFAGLHGSVGDVSGASVRCCCRCTFTRSGTTRTRCRRAHAPLYIGTVLRRNLSSSTSCMNISMSRASLATSSLRSTSPSVGEYDAEPPQGT